MVDGFEQDGTVGRGTAAGRQDFAIMGAALAPPAPSTPRAPWAPLAGDLGRVSAPSVGSGAPGLIASMTPPPPLLSLLASIAACLLLAAVPPLTPPVVVVPEGGSSCGWRCRGPPWEVTKERDTARRTDHLTLVWQSCGAFLY